MFKPVQLPHPFLCTWQEQAALPLTSPSKGSHFPVLLDSECSLEWEGK